MELKESATNLWIICVLLVTTVLPRAAALGDFPYLDDGYHAFMAQYIYHSLEAQGAFPADVIGYKLFESLFAWVFALPGNPLFWLRLADLCAAGISGWFLCRLLTKESGNALAGLLLAGAALAGLNLPGVIQSGFKHGFFPAFACFFAALYLVESAPARSPRWIYAGMLAALAVLFRETFFPFVLLACAGFLVSGNFQALWRFMTGGITGWAIVTVAWIVLRQQVYEIFEFYLIYGQIYGPEAMRRWLKFVENGGRALVLFSPLLILSLMAAVALLLQKERQYTGRAFFWLLCALLPLLEPLLKIGFLYHFSVCMPGMAGFCAYAFSRLPGQKETMKKAAIWACAIAFCLMCPQLYGHFLKLPQTLEVVKSFPDRGWPESLEADSTTLQAAKRIRELLPANGTVSSSGFAYFIFPASQTLPPQMALGDLSRTYIYSGYDPARFVETLRRNPPDVVLLAHAEADHSEIFEEELRSIFSGLPEYEPAGTVETGRSKNYGWLGYSLFKRVARD